jgi:hypothetical protein
MSCHSEPCLLLDVLKVLLGVEVLDGKRRLDLEPGAYIRPLFGSK